jgi:tRNA-Thr(GGU) m(6)t(6)A37 methyltransferase TsaA
VSRDELVVRPIGFVRSPFGEKVEAPRQAVLAQDVTGTVEVLPKYADALSDLEGFDRVWLITWFDRSDGSTSALKVLPPRSTEKRGLFATRSPHRINPIGLSAVRLERIAGCTLHVRELDLIDGTPVLDIKPYIAYADAFPDASTGWLGATMDTRPTWTVAFEPGADEALAWIEREAAFDLRSRVIAALSLGAQPHAYRRIKQTPNGPVLAVKEWRAWFHVSGEHAITVDRIESGYGERDLAKSTEPAIEIHRAFTLAMKRSR